MQPHTAAMTKHRSQIFTHTYISYYNTGASVCGAVHFLHGHLGPEKAGNGEEGGELEHV